MNKKIRLASLALAAMLAVSCGNKTGNSNPETATGTPELTGEPAVETPAPETVAAAEPLNVSLTENYNFCIDGKPDILAIKGGTPFADEAKPYKVTVKKNSFDGAVRLGKFQKKDGATVVAVTPSTNNISEEGNTLTLIVTDADGNTQEIKRFIEYCP